MHEYTVVLTPAHDGDGYVATVPALGGVMTQGVDRDDTIAMARELIALELATLQHDGEELPIDPSPSELVRVSVTEDDMAEVVFLAETTA